MTTISKTQLKAKALAIFREVERTGQPVIITDRGRPVLRLVPYAASDDEALSAFRGAVLEYTDPLSPVGEDDWAAAQ